MEVGVPAGGAWHHPGKVAPNKNDRVRHYDPEEVAIAPGHNRGYTKAAALPGAVQGPDTRLWLPEDTLWVTGRQSVLFGLKN